MSSQLASSSGDGWPRTSQALARSIFKADLPEQFVRGLPAQSLYCVLQHNGLESSADLVEVVTLDQCRVLIDFDIWNKDVVNEEQFWKWLALTDATDRLELLQKIVACLDLKLIALLISRYVDVQVFEDPSDIPPGPDYHTPDKGRTWITINNLESSKEFLLKRLMALLFESNPDLFYQLLAIPSVSTQAALEEEAYQDRQKRLQAEGIPDQELACATHGNYYLSDLEIDLKSFSTNPSTVDLHPIQPMIYDSDLADPLQRLLNAVADREECEAELSFILNCAIVRWSVDFSAAKDMQFLIEQVKGATSIGVELVEQSGIAELAQALTKISLQKVYRLGLTRVMGLRKLALKVTAEQLRDLANSNPANFKMIACLRETFPCLPSENPEDGDQQRALSRNNEIQRAEEILKALLGRTIA